MNIEVTMEMKELLLQLADLCEQIGDEVIENEETKKILITCDRLSDMIDNYIEEK